VEDDRELDDVDVDSVHAADTECVMECEHGGNTTPLIPPKRADSVGGDNG
jgi:hypothetical protein